MSKEKVVVEIKKLCNDIITDQEDAIAALRRAKKITNGFGGGRAWTAREILQLIEDKNPDVD